MNRYQVTTLFCGLPQFFEVFNFRDAAALACFNECYNMLKDNDELNGPEACKLMGTMADVTTFATSLSVCLGNHEVKFEEVPPGP